jgi:regulatory protein
MAESILFKTALNKAMAQCSRREYCIRDIEVKLNEWGLNESDCQKITGILIKENFLNEERYASAFARDKFKYNKWGRIKITAHLRAKNIPAEKIKNALDTIDNDLYKKSLNDIISSHRKTIKAKNQYDLNAKLLRYGASKGFESSLLYDILNDIEE